MLFPLSGIPAVEYDATFTISPTSRSDHSSDTVLASIEVLVRNDSSERLTFPFMVLSTDSGEGATDPASVEPKVLNGSHQSRWAPTRSMRKPPPKRPSSGSQQAVATPRRSSRHGSSSWPRCAAPRGAESGGPTSRLGSRAASFCSSDFVSSPIPLTARLSSRRSPHHRC